MKILWTVNLIPSDFAQAKGYFSDVLGGWVESMASEIKDYNDIELAICCKCENENYVFSEEFNGIFYFSLPYSATDGFNAVKEKCKKIIESFKPDLIQIEGTEFLHARAMLTAAKEKDIPTVVSLQGILNGQYNYQCGQLQVDDMMFSKSLTEIFAGWILHLRKSKWYAGRLPNEKSVIENADNFIGRTTWDRAHSYAINPKAKYFSINRVLRKPFYNHKWDYEKCEKHSIYVGNGYYALKGAHYVVKALGLLKKEFPDIKVYIAGYKPFSENDKRSFLKKGYGAYLKKLIDDIGVAENIVFTGPLKADEVAQMLSKVNAYVLCSAIENSPNTLGEAMMVGTPCVSAYVGGAPDMANDGEEALFYRNDDEKLLAWCLKRVFDSKELCLSLSEKAKKRALVTHNAEDNVKKLYEAYKDILSGEKK